jgi:DNA modification methylase
MTPFYADDWLTLYGGDCLEVMRSMPSDSVDCVVTSPPYWGLRDYGTATWEGGDTECDHVETYNLKRDASGGLGGGRDLGTRGVQGNTSSSKIGYRDTCGKCGATRIDSQLGLERTPEEYVANMVNVFREVRRVLKPSGTCWLNLGDSYAHNTEAHPTQRGTDPKMATSARARVVETTGVAKARGAGLKPKDLVGIPWRVAFALQADGWYLRSDVIWSKPNPMPESVTDRPTKSHEYLFLLTKSARYYFDQEGVREPEKPWNGGRINAPKFGPERLVGGSGAPGTTSKTFEVIKGANIRSVWTIATRPYPGAHFAVFPPELPERCIKAGSPELGVILDPFAGSGTVGMVANRLSRRAILIDLNPEYLKQQMTRNAQTPLGLGAA